MGRLVKVGLVLLIADALRGYEEQGVSHAMFHVVPNDLESLRRLTNALNFHL